MQKKYYTAPEAEIEKFTISNVITDSTPFPDNPNPGGGSGDGENDGGEF